MCCSEHTDLVQAFGAGRRELQEYDTSGVNKSLSGNPVHADAQDSGGWKAARVS